MQWFKTKDGSVYAYDLDVPTDQMIPDLTPMSDAEVQAHIEAQDTGNPVPAVVTKAQGVMALYYAGKLELVKEAVAAAGPAAQLAFDTIGEFHRDSPLMAAIAGPLNIDLDALFIAADQIKI